MLANGRGVAVVDAEDAETVAGYAWYRHQVGNLVYARADVGGRRSRRRIYMHVLIAGARPDHIDGDGLNNRRGNLRPATRGQNQANQRVKPGRYKGVWRDPRRKAAGGWLAYITVNGERRTLGLYPIPEDAARAYDVAAVEAWGPYARVNFPAGHSATGS
jgi:hypothetical protein